MDLNQNETYTEIIREIVDSLPGEMVKITISSGFHQSVHRELLLSQAPWFNGAFTGNFHEADTGCINLRDTEIEDQHTIEMFVLWLYSFDLEKEGPSRSWLQVSKLWVFADKIHAIGLQNKAINILLTKWRLQGPNVSVNTLCWIWEHSVPGSKLRELFLDISLHMDLENARASAEDMPVELLQQIFVSVRGTIDYDALQISQTKYYVKQIDAKPVKKEISDAHLAGMIAGKTWRLYSKDSPYDVELRLEDCWESTEKIFSTIRDLKESVQDKEFDWPSPFQTLKKWDKDIYKIQEIEAFVAQDIEIEGLLVKTSDGTLQIRRNDEDKLREAVSSLAYSIDPSADVEMIISYA